jgi:hypothetical protein
MQTLTVYLGRDNTEDLVLFADGVPQDLPGVTRVVLTIGDIEVDSTVAPAGTITWPQALTWQDAPVEGIRFKLGAEDLMPGIYSGARLVLYGAAAPAGLVWSDALTVRVKA